MTSRVKRAALYGLNGRTDFNRVSQKLQSLSNKVCFETAAEESEYLNERINGQAVGFGGSATLRLIFFTERTDDGK